MPRRKHADREGPVTGADHLKVAVHLLAMAADALRDAARAFEAEDNGTLMVLAESLDRSARSLMVAADRYVELARKVL